MAFKQFTKIINPQCTGHNDRQIPGISPDMLQKLMAPLTGAAGLLPLGRHEPSHEHSDRGDHHAAEGHERQLQDPAELSKKLGELLKNAAGQLQLGRGLVAHPGTAFKLQSFNINH